MLDNLMYYICIPLGWLMKQCWLWVGNYGVAILLFTLLSKIVILPVTVWVHKNSIKMVRIQPEINFLKAKYYGDLDTVAAEQSKLFKRERYSPAASIVSLVLQLFLLSSIITIIYHPLTYLLGVSPETVATLAEVYGIEQGISSTEILIVEAVKYSSMMPSGFSVELMRAISALDFGFLGFNISEVASETLGKNLLIPLLAGISSWILCLSQNALNPLQHEQSKWNKYGMMVFSVGLSLYLGFFVPAGIVIYWVFSNLFSVVQQVLLNLAISPKKHIDYEALEKSREALAAIEALEVKDEHFAENKRRERTDYKRFFGVVNKHVVIYSEKSGFYKYFEDIIRELLERSNLHIHYVTSDPDDVIFSVAEKEPRIRAYYIGNKKLITLMMRMEADIVMMTTPDLDKYYIKRSLVQKDIEYIYIPHDPMSAHMGFRENALDAFDTIFCTGPHIEREVRATERVYGLPPKKLVHFGYPLAEKLIAAHEGEESQSAGGRKQILIAPSWQEDNLLDSCIDELLEGLLSDEYRIIVRPHPEYVKRYGEKMRALTEKYADRVGDGLVFELDFSSNRSIWSSDLLVTDWSGISLEFCFATKRPALFVNTQMKVENPNWQKIDCIPVEISLRNTLGVALEKDELSRVDETVRRLLANPDEYADKIGEALEAHFYNQGSAAQAGALYILESLMEKRKKNKGEKS
ncbi:MAG: membrane protein insertase YidC [Ruminococcaceae bacterium]|nr:membrane protein insertase YidC [Oscillospiraceae bacterium]